MSKRCEYTTIKLKRTKLGRFTRTLLRIYVYSMCSIRSPVAWIRWEMYTWHVDQCVRASKRLPKSGYVCFIGCWLWQRSKWRRATYMNVYHSLCVWTKIKFVNKWAFFPCIFREQPAIQHLASPHTHPLATHTHAHTLGFFAYSPRPHSNRFQFGFDGWAGIFECEYICGVHMDEDKDDRNGIYWGLWKRAIIMRRCFYAYKLVHKVYMNTWI